MGWVERAYRDLPVVKVNMQRVIASAASRASAGSSEGSPSVTVGSHDGSPVKVSYLLSL